MIKKNSVDWSKYASLEEMSEYAQKIGFKTSREYMMYGKANFPEHFYGNPQAMPGFLDKGGWGWFLGTGRRRYGDDWATLEETMEFIRELNRTICKDEPILNMAAWCRYASDKSNNVPSRYPSRVNIHYGQEYKEKGPFKKLLGQTLLWDHETSREYVRNKKFKSSKEFFIWAASDQRPKQCPRTPDVTYKDKGFINMRDYLGLESSCPDKLSELMNIVNKNPRIKKMVSDLAGTVVKVDEMFDNINQLHKGGDIAEIIKGLNKRQQMEVAHDIVRNSID